MLIRRGIFDEEFHEIFVGSAKQGFGQTTTLRPVWPSTGRFGLAIFIQGTKSRLPQGFWQVYRLA